MGYIGDEIAAAMAAVGARGAICSDFTSSSIAATLAERFAKKRHSTYLWEDFDERVSVRDPDAWRWVSDFAAGKTTILSFNPQDERLVFRFLDGSEIAPVLAECTGFEFYVTDPEFSYALCFNHHDYLIATGSALDWLSWAKRKMSLCS